MKRFLFGVALGTLVLGAITFVLMSANGAPVAGNWQAMLAYPTGSDVSYFLLAMIIYGLSLAITCWRRSPRRTTQDSPRTTISRNSAPSGTSPGRGSGRAGKRNIPRA